MLMAEGPFVHRTAFGLSDIGRRRLSNEDALLVDNELGLYVVADGMGGHNAGEVASGEAVDALHGMVARERDALHAMDGVERRSWLPSVSEMPAELRKTVRLLESAVQAATYMVFGLGQTHPERKGMGTTMSALLLRGEYAITAQVGDSRIYLMRDGNAEQVTEDHTLVDTRTLAVRATDRFLLCSDGLHGYLDDAEVANFAEGTVEDAAKHAITLANQRGGRDNITAVFVELES